MVKMRQLRMLLKAEGFFSRRGRGSHEVWIDPQQPRRRVVLSGKNSDDAPKYQAARVRKFRRGAMIYRHR